MIAKAVRNAEGRSELRVLNCFNRFFKAGTLLEVSIMASEVKCPTCGGKGVIKEGFPTTKTKQCPNCGGTGKVTKPK
jgi:DnaJ-class molecular chaperone